MAYFSTMPMLARALCEAYSAMLRITSLAAVERALTILMLPVGMGGLVFFAWWLAVFN